MTRAEHVLDAWKRMYVAGDWTLEQFEKHLTAMLPVIPHDWWSHEAGPIPFPRSSSSSLSSRGKPTLAG